MAASDDSQIAEWLGLTSQQYEILTIVLDLHLEKRKASPKAIVDRYAGIHGKRIQKSNLFTQLNFLIDNEFLLKEEKADYSVNFEGIKNRLALTREKLHKSFDDFERVAGDVEKYLQRATSEPSKPIVKYLDYGEIHDFIGKRVRYAKDYLSVSFFPGIFTYSISKDSENRTGYLDILKQRGFQRKELRIVYVTALDIGHIFRKLVNKVDDPLVAYKDSESVIAQFGQDIVKYPNNLDIRYVSRPRIFDFSLPVLDENNIDELFIFTRDETEEINGGIYIKSQDTARAIHNKFLVEYSRGERIDKSNVKKWTKKLHMALKNEYALYVDKTKKKKMTKKLTY